MTFALQEAKSAYIKNEIPIGAVIVGREGVITKSHNRTIADRNPTAHAEILAIEKACNLLQTPYLMDYDLYTTLEPCPMCAYAISLSKIKRLYIGALDPKYGMSKVGLYNSNFCNHIPEVYQGICEEESSKLLKDFFRERR